MIHSVTNPSLVLLAFQMVTAAPSPVPVDPAARGLDLFVVAPPSAPEDSELPIAVTAYGFPEVTRLVPLQNATVRAAWDPEAAGADLPAAVAKTGPGGRAELRLGVPAGEAGKLVLLVSLQHGDHQRTRVLEVSRVRNEALRLHVGERSVVPGSTINAWVIAEQPATGAPLAHVPIELALLEGGIVRWSQRPITDASGSAAVRIPIPLTSEVHWSWELRAAVVRARRLAASVSITLHPREETPATPRLHASFDRPHLLAGEQSGFQLRAYDAAGRPLSGAVIRYWIGSRGAEPKDAAHLERASIRRRTDLEGSVRGTAAAPEVISPRGGALLLLARAEIEGHALTAESSLSIGVPHADVELIPEGGVLIPGIEQRLLLRATSISGAPLVGELTVTGDGLEDRLQTNASGEAELTWRVPPHTGANHPSGACASSVASTVVIRPAGIAAREQLGRDRLERCVPVDRDAEYLLLLDRPIVRAGEQLGLRIAGGRGRAFRVVAQGARGAPPFAATIADGERGGKLSIPATASGTLQLSALSPKNEGAAITAAGAALVLPAILPRLTATITGGRITPGGYVELEAVITGDHGQPLTGAVSVAMTDLHGGGSAAGLMSLDTRTALVSGFDLGWGWDRAGPFLDAGAELDPLRRAALARRIGAPLEPLADPAKDARARFEEAFATVVKSLEGAVYESTASPDLLLDARRKTPRGFELNPELFTLVTTAMEEPPLTPGGEPIALKDLIALDDQVRFDQVARRVTRLKLFRVLEQVRTFVHEQRLMPDEVALREPNAILRRLVREGTLEESLLLDPWGHTLAFVRAPGPPLPYLSPVPGWRLHSPGPDGRLGTGDDVNDPFGRVLRSGTPYARAVEEDRLVDARYDVVVGDDTVAMWSELFQSFTGSVLGSAGAMGLGTVGYGAGGGGRGAALHAGSGTVRGGQGIVTPATVWIPPQRTDAQGRVRLRLPLGDHETTWRMSLIAIPDGAPAAADFVDVAVALPLSVRADAGAAWIEGDHVAIAVSARNRGNSPAELQLTYTASGAIVLEERAGPRVLEVPPRGEERLAIRARAIATGLALLEITVRSGSEVVDHLVHRFEVRPAATVVERWVARSIADRTQLVLDDGLAPAGASWIELSHGLEPVLRAALEGLDPDRLHTRDAEALALEGAMRIARWSLSRHGERAPLTLFAEERARRALARALAFGQLGAHHGRFWSSTSRLTFWGALLPELPASLQLPAVPECPAAGGLDALVDAMSVEPPPAGGAVRACWDSAVAEAVQGLSISNDPILLARAALAVLERPHRKELAANLIARLQVMVRPERGTLVLQAAADRSARALAGAALLRGAAFAPGLDPAALLEALRAQQGPQGDFGSAEATRAAIVALLHAGSAGETPRRVTIEVEGRRPLILELGPGQTRRYTLDSATLQATLQSEGGPIVARLVQPGLRPWSRPPEPEGDLVVETRWPDDAMSGEKSLLRLSLRHGRPRVETVEVRLPLPSGVRLAEAVPNVKQVQGVLVVRTALGSGSIPTLLDLPIRADLPGRMTIPEGVARIVSEDSVGAHVPARPWVVKARR